jgi:hypothetical protein
MLMAFAFKEAPVIQLHSEQVRQWSQPVLGWKPFTLW